jgi:hypothetical protein
MEGMVAAVVFLGAILGSVGLGACIVLCAREHWTATSERIRRLIKERARRDSNP